MRSCGVAHCGYGAAVVYQLWAPRERPYFPSGRRSVSNMNGMLDSGEA
jgi:hypothetical protein